MSKKTERLCMMLDKHEVEHSTMETEDTQVTFWEFGDGSRATFAEFSDGEMALLTLGTVDSPERAVAATLCHDNPDVLQRLESLRGGHYNWPRLFEAVVGDSYSDEWSPSESEELFIEYLICLIGGGKEA